MSNLNLLLFYFALCSSSTVHYTVGYDVSEKDSATLDEGSEVHVHDVNQTCHPIDHIKRGISNIGLKIKNAFISTKNAIKDGVSAIRNKTRDALERRQQFQLKKEGKLTTTENYDTSTGIDAEKETGTETGNNFNFQGGSYGIDNPAFVSEGNGTPSGTQGVNNGQGGIFDNGNNVVDSSGGVTFGGIQGEFSKSDTTTDTSPTIDIRSGLESATEKN